MPVYYHFPIFIIDIFSTCCAQYYTFKDGRLLYWVSHDSSLPGTYIISRYVRYHFSTQQKIAVTKAQKASISLTYRRLLYHFSLKR